MYANENGYLGKRLLNDAVLLRCDQDSKNIIKVDISDEFIKYPKEGVFVGVEMIKIIKGETKEHFPAFKFTKKKKKNISSISFIKSIFRKNEWGKINSYNNLLDHFPEYNLAVSINLDIYKK